MEEKEKDLDINRLWLIFSRRKWFFILPAAILTFFGILIAIGLPTVYEANCLLLVQEPRAIQGILEEKGGEKLGKTEDLAKTVGGMMLGWEPVTNMMKEVGLLSGQQQNVYKTEALYKDIVERVNIKAQSDTLIAVTFQDKQPFISYKAMNGLVSNFMELFLRLARSQADASVSFIEKDLKHLREKLDESEEKLKQFEEEHASELPDDERNNLAKMHNLTDALSDVNLQIAIQKDKLSIIDESLSKEGSTILGEIVKVPNPKVSEIQKRVDELESTLASMRAKYYDTHPSMVLIRKELESLHDKLKEQEATVVGAEKTVNNPVHEQMVTKRYDEIMQLRGLELKKKEIEGSIAKLDESVKAIPSVKKMLTELRRNYDVTKNLYNERLAQKSKEELRREMSMYATASPFTIIEPPRIPTKSVKSTRIKVLIIAIFLGLAIGIGLLFLTELIDQRFKGVEDAKEFLQMPLLGIVPTIRLAEDVQRERRKKLRTIIAIGAASGLVGLIIIAFILIAPGIIEKGLDTIQRIVG